MTAGRHQFIRCSSISGTGSSLMPNPFPIIMMLALVTLGWPGGGTIFADRANAQFSIRQRIIIRIPRMPFSKAAPAPNAKTPIRWAEKKAPKCVAIQRLSGAVITASDSIDLMTDGTERLRAKLDDDCPPIDFYSGFYLKPTQDGMVCAGRDAIRSRSGGSCPIEAFKRLVPKH